MLCTWLQCLIVLGIQASCTVATPWIQVSVPPAFQNTANVTVTWGGVTGGDSNYTVAAYSPADFTPYVHALTTKDAGKWTLTLQNIRNDWIFKLWRGTPDFTNSTMLAQSNTLKVDSGVVMHLHTSWTSHAGEVQVMWVDDTHGQVPSVQWGYTADNMPNTAQGGTTTYTKDMLSCGTQPDKTAVTYFIDPGSINTVVLRGLKPGMPIYYRVGHVGNKMAGKIHRHTGAPLAPGSPTGRFLYVADMGVGPASPTEINGALNREGTAISRENAGPKAGGRLVVNRILKDEDLSSYQFILHNGDISYACGESWIHEAFGAMVEPIAAHLPYMVTLGNHEYDFHGMGWGTQFHSEYDNDSGGDCGVAYARRFQMPQAEQPQPSSPAPVAFTPYYSFDSGPIHVAIISIEHNFTVGSAQYNWLQRDLSAVNRTLTPWVIVAHHRQIFLGALSIDSRHNNRTDYGYGDASLLKGSALEMAMRASLEPLYVGNKVDLVLTAHEHTYSRTCPLAHGKCARGAPIYVVDGTAGAYGSTETCKQPQPPYPFPVASMDCAWGYSRVEATHTQLKFEHLRQVDGSIVDSVIVHK